MKEQILTRRVSESIEIDGIKFTILAAHGNTVKILIQRQEDSNQDKKLEE